jgi:hypothetical protein
VLAGGRDYDETAIPKLTPYIRAANVVVNRMVQCAQRRGFIHTAEELVEIETWLAAYYYTKSDRIYTSKSTKGASGSFQMNPIEPEPYRDAAFGLDFSGCLKTILNSKRARFMWGGKPYSDQIGWRDRNGLVGGGPNTGSQ